MTNRSHIGILATLSFIMVLIGCRVFQPPRATITIADGRYDSEFPTRPVSPALKQVLESVHFLNSVAYYRGYEIPLEKRFTRRGAPLETIKRVAAYEMFFNRTASGTATVIYAQGRHLALLTCNHVINFPDTLYTYYVDENGIATPYLQNIAIKQRQENYIPDLLFANQLEILAADPHLDIAILGQELPRDPIRPIRVFNFPLGKARELDWGTVLYLIGFPKGFKMVTTGIVSSPNRDRNFGFLVDAPFNKGFSGGIALALRDGPPHFELVGIINAVSADRITYLAPESGALQKEYRPGSPYEGTPIVKEETRINYGVTFGIAIEKVQELLESHRDFLEKRGYNFDFFYMNPQ